MTRKKRLSRPANRNRFIGVGRLYDQDGRLWKLIDGQLSKSEVKKLLAQATTPVGMHLSYGELHWLPLSERRSVWDDEIEPVSVDATNEDTWEPPPRHRASLPCYGTLYRSGEDVLLMFDNFD